MFGLSGLTQVSVKRRGELRCVCKPDLFNQSMKFFFFRLGEIDTMGN